MSEEQILDCHFLATRGLIPGGDNLFLVVHDTTEFSYKREDIGSLRSDSLQESVADFWPKTRPRLPETSC
jgi:hypothetical protein